MAHLPATADYQLTGGIVHSQGNSEHSLRPVCVLFVPATRLALVIPIRDADGFFQSLAMPDGGGWGLETGPRLTERPIIAV